MNRRPIRPETRRLAGILLVVLPTVAFGGASILSLLLSGSDYLAASPIRREMFRAGHAHAGVLLVLSLAVLSFVDEAELSDRARGLVRVAAPTAAILMPAGFFLSVAAPGATRPNALVGLIYLGALILGAGLIGLGVGLLRNVGPRP